MAHIPKGFVCTQQTERQYNELEREMMPLIKAKASKIRKFAGYEDMDDALQEGRLALLAALIGYDEEKGNGLSKYVGTILDNTYRHMLYRMLSETKVPYAIEQTIEGGWMKRPSRPVSLSLLDEDGYEFLEPVSSRQSPEDEVLEGQLKEQARLFKLKLLNTLKGQHKIVFECKTNPPVEFLKMVSNMGGDIYKPTNIHIAKYLGVTKNSVDTSLYRIREIFTAMARGEEFSDLLGAVVESERWPMYWMSKKACYDKEFVREIMRQNELDPKPIPGYQNEPDFKHEAGMYSRMIERYEWGVVVVLRRKSSWRTIVVVGKFNAIQGDVFGTSGAHERIPVSWYGKMVKALKKAG